MQGSKHRLVTDLPKDLLVEIFSRVPYKSLCRCRCVSRSWHALCSDPNIVKKSPQTLSGFIFYAGDKQGRHRLLNLSGSGRAPLLDSLTPFQCHYSSIRLVHSCNGLLLWRCCKHPASSYEVDYVVCNPATKQWTVLPPDEMELRGIMWQAYRLCFDPAISSHFRVFMFLPGYICGGPFKGVAIFSSETGGWAYRESELLGDNSRVSDYSHAAFVNGILHMTAAASHRDYSLITVDTEGKAWGHIPMPCKMDHCSTSFGHSQGRLYVTRVDLFNACQLSVWVLEDYDSKQWTLKHTVRILELLGRHQRSGDESYHVIAIHPECNLVFIIQRTREQHCLMSYDMDNLRLQVICSLDEYSLVTSAPYVPYFGELQLSD